MCDQVQKYCYILYLNRADTKICNLCPNLGTVPCFTVRLQERHKRLIQYSRPWNSKLESFLYEPEF